jgi:precorrin-6A/cobalt-precorrin-6A reductase
LILGGTAEAAELAGRAIGAYGARLDVITSLSGATAEPSPPPGRMVGGGFGGAAGLARYLRVESVDFLIDATHPFAAVMQLSAASAAGEAGVPRCRLLRPAWPRHPDDDWTEVENEAAAARAVARMGRHVFLALGGREIEPFLALAAHRFLLRAVSPPPLKLPVNFEFLRARGPFAAADELGLMQQRRIDAVVSRQSGGRGAYAKIEAARTLGLPVVMIRRPPPPPPPLVATVDEALGWLQQAMKE